MGKLLWIVFLALISLAWLHETAADVALETEADDEPLDPDEDDDEPWDVVIRDLDSVPDDSEVTSSESREDDEVPPQPHPAMPQCPCVKLPGSSECAPIAFDPEYQADSLEEAIKNFRNPNGKLESKELLDEDIKELIEEGERPAAGRGRGQTSETKNRRKGCCQKMISSITSFAKRLRGSLRNSTLAHAKRLRKACKMDNRSPDQRKKCGRGRGKKGRKGRKKFRRTANYKDLIPNIEVDDDPETEEELQAIWSQMRRPVQGQVLPGYCRDRKWGPKKCARQLRKKDRRQRKFKKNTRAQRKYHRCLRKNTRRPQGKKKKCRRPRRGGRRPGRGRGKRNTGGVSSTSWPAECDYRRGNDLNEDDGWVGLCNLCWAWRILDEQYYPKFINEISCDTQEKTCLGGFGECRPRWRSVQVMYNTGTSSNVNWRQQSINVQVGCECRIKPGSPLHGFISG